MYTYLGILHVPVLPAAKVPSLKRKFVRSTESPRMLASLCLVLATSPFGLKKVCRVLKKYSKRTHVVIKVHVEIILRDLTEHY